MKAKNLFYLFAVAAVSFVVAIGCETANPRYPQIITPIFIAQGELYGNGQEGITKQNLVIKTPQEWNNLLNAMNSVNNVSDNFTETEIDFNSYMLIAVFDKIRGNSGCSINIANIIEYADSIVVDVHSYIATSGADVMNQPYYIVKIPATNKNIVFEFNISNDTVPIDTIPIDTVPLRRSVWEWLPFPSCTDVTITLTFDSLTNVVYVSTYPQYLGGGYYNNPNLCPGPMYYYLFNEGNQFVVSGNKLKLYNDIYGRDYEVFEISSTGYMCDTIDLIGINIIPPAGPPGVFVKEYTFIHTTD